MKLEIRRIWEDGTWDDEIIKAPSFVIMGNNDTWERLRIWCDKLSMKAKYSKTVHIYPLMLLSEDSI